MTGNKVGGLLLAAGGSSRLGQPKQLLQFKGKTLLRHAAEAMAGSMCDPVVVVLGAETERSANEIEGLPVVACVNENWQIGMSSSIKAGLAKLCREIEPDIDAVLISLCDQPFVTRRNAGPVRREIRGRPMPASLPQSTTASLAFLHYSLVGCSANCHGLTAIKEPGT